MVVIAKMIEVIMLIALIYERQEQNNYDEIYAIHTYDWHTMLNISVCESPDQIVPSRLVGWISENSSHFLVSFRSNIQVLFMKLGRVSAYCNYTIKCFFKNDNFDWTSRIILTLQIIFYWQFRDTHSVLWLIFWCVDIPWI